MGYRGLQGSHTETSYRPPSIPSPNNLTFAQRRQLVELRIDRVIVDDVQVEIRYVVPTGPKGSAASFRHLRLDYLSFPPTAIPVHHRARTGTIPHLQPVQTVLRLGRPLGFCQVQMLWTQWSGY
jgi:hypothetical protein